MACQFSVSHDRIPAIIIRYIYYTGYNILLRYSHLALAAITELAMLRVTVLCLIALRHGHISRSRAVSRLAPDL